LKLAFVIGEKVDVGINRDQHPVVKRPLFLQKKAGQGQTDDLASVLGIVDELEGQFTRDGLQDIENLGGMESGSWDAHLLQAILNKTLNLAEPESRDDEAVADPFQKFGGVINQVAAHSDAWCVSGIIEVLDSKIPVNGQHPV